MNLDHAEISDIIEKISTLDTPCLYEMAVAIQSPAFPHFGVEALRELGSRDIIVMMNGAAHPLLVDIRPCHVCGWRYLMSRQQHESWYTSHTTSYRHLYMSGPS